MVRRCWSAVKTMYLPPLPPLLLLLRLIRPLSPSDRDIDAARPGQSIGCGVEFSSFEPTTLSRQIPYARERCFTGTCEPQTWWRGPFCVRVDTRKCSCVTDNGAWAE